MIYYIEFVVTSTCFPLKATPYLKTVLTPFEIISALSGFPIRADIIAVIHHSANPQNKTMIKVFSGSIIAACRLEKKLMHLLLQPLCIIRIQCLLNGDCCSLGNDIGQFLQNFFVIHKRNLPVGQRHLAHILTAESRIYLYDFQIACNQKKAVNGGRIISNMGINNSSVDIRQERFPLQ